jgi:hypothetical protein
LDAVDQQGVDGLCTTSAEALDLNITQAERIWTTEGHDQLAKQMWNHYHANWLDVF